MSTPSLGRQGSVIYLIICIITVVAWVVPLVVSPDQVSNLVLEDGVYEYLTCLFLIVSTILFFLAFLKSPRSGQKYWYLLLALTMFFGAGEEISWGQRIFGWETPPDSINVQGETNIHNLPLFDTVEGSVLNMSRLFMIFCLLWGVVLPLMSHMQRAFGFVWTLISRLQIPLVPLALGLLFPINIVISKIFQRMIDEAYIERIAEVREATHALVLLGIAWFFYSTSTSTSAAMDRTKRS